MSTEFLAELFSSLILLLSVISTFAFQVHENLYRENRGYLLPAVRERWLLLIPVVVRCVTAYLCIEELKLVVTNSWGVQFTVAALIGFLVGAANSTPVAAVLRILEKRCPWASVLADAVSLVGDAFSQERSLKGIEESVHQLKERDFNAIVPHQPELEKCLNIRFEINRSDFFGPGEEPLFVDQKEKWLLFVARFGRDEAWRLLETPISSPWPSWSGEERRTRPGNEHDRSGSHSVSGKIRASDYRRTTWRRFALA